MMNRFLLAALVLLAACNSKENEGENAPSKNIPSVTIGDTVANFFPVTSYLRGELYNIKLGGITPIKKTTINNITDSAWVSEGNFENTFAPFLFPVIDTANLKPTFTEKKFLDQTLNAFTFTYDPVNIVSDTFAFKHWDVYVDPDNNKVRRIYLTKKVGENTELRLTWQSGKWCKIVTLNTENGLTKIVKEEKIYWTFEE
ncbi:MAG: hypothetical protein ACKVOM_04930 [Ferruginibacter sp.]